MRAFTLGRNEYLFLSLTLVLLGLIAAWFASPAIYHQWCVRHYIPSMQDRFGFRADRIHVPDLSYEPLAVVDIKAGGPFSRAGFRLGDIPVDYHGGDLAFCGALQGAEQGEHSTVSVINAGDWHKGERPRREITIPPVAP